MGIDQLHMMGKGPYPLPMNRFMKKVDICMDTNVFITIPKSGIDFLEKAQHTHDSYEFVIPYTVMPYLSLEKKRHVGEKNKITPINSGQAHGPHDRMLNTHLIALNIDNDFLNEIAHSIYGKSNVCFKQGNYSFGNALKTLIQMFVEEHRNVQPGRRLVLKSLSTQIAAHLLRQIENNMPVSFHPGYNTTKKNLDKAIEYLRDEYDEKYSLEEAAKAAHLSPYYFIKAFKSHTGKTPYEYITYLRIQNAKELLVSNNISITEVCFKCGFNSLSNFTTLFKRRVGVTPSQYRRIIHNK
ncbi:AraC-type DNA-binding protein [Desulfotomaculum arcticum]|uniref:AraC-type DNA-binding protein n=1 Tax=Desulfotruncus arcticus DSM 17038 TaxID=1121424 RepID=A0A1I2V376_9FIRM|nr:helix-turn-helix domain-containing protein [Desulfotruncus arcticus]SFG82717.1 AraC-type DNA-binding protein [Desulfotomaculum arcticum] [Desulfotruncus arcticus DSM 17038]